MFAGTAEKHVTEAEKGVATGYHFNRSSHASSARLEAFLHNMGKNMHSTPYMLVNKGGK